MNRKQTATGKARATATSRRTAPAAPKSIMPPEPRAATAAERRAERERERAMEEPIDITPTPTTPSPAQRSAEEVLNDVDDGNSIDRGDSIDRDADSVDEENLEDECPHCSRQLEGGECVYAKCPGKSLTPKPESSPEPKRKAKSVPLPVQKVRMTAVLATTPTCAQCPAWNKTGNGLGECRMNPPGIDQMQASGRFPITGGDAWCQTGRDRMYGYRVTETLLGKSGK